MTTSASMELAKRVAYTNYICPLYCSPQQLHGGSLYLGAFGTPAVSPVQSLPTSNLIRTDIPWKVFKNYYLTNFGQCWVVTVCVLEGRRCSLAVLRGLSTALASLLGRWDQLLCGMWDLPGPGIGPVSPALASEFLTTGPPGKSFFPGKVLTTALIWYLIELGNIYFLPEQLLAVLAVLVSGFSQNCSFTLYYKKN